VYGHLLWDVKSSSTPSDHSDGISGVSESETELLLLHIRSGERVLNQSSLSSKACTDRHKPSDLASQSVRVLATSAEHRNGNSCTCASSIHRGNGTWRRALALRGTLCVRGVGIGVTGWTGNVALGVGNVGWTFERVPLYACVPWKACICVRLASICVAH